MVLTLQREDKNSEIEKNAVEFREIENSEVEKKNKAEESEHFENQN